MKTIKKLVDAGIILFALCLAIGGFIVTERVSADENISINADEKNRVVGSDIYFDRYLGFNVKCVEQGTVSFEVADSDVATIGDYPNYSIGGVVHECRYAIFPTGIDNKTDTTLTVKVTAASGRVYSKKYNLHKCNIPSAIRVEDSQVFVNESITPKIKGVNVAHHFDGLYEVLKLNPNIITYKSSNPNIATIDSSGKVTGIKAGDTTITVTYKYSHYTMAYNKQGVLEGVSIANPTATYTVNVYDKTTSIVFNTKQITLNKGDLYKQNIVHYPINGITKKEYEWTSSNPEVATVDENGNVVAKGMGSSKITATTTDGSKKSDSFTVYVKTDAPTYVNVHYYDGYIRLSWNENSEASSYEILRANSPTEEFKNVGSTKGTSYDDKSVEYGKTYYYKVACVPLGGNKCKSAYTMSTGIKYSIVSPKIKKIKVKKRRCTLKIGGAKYDKYVIYVSKKKKPKKVYAVVSSKRISFSLKKGSYYIRIKSLAIKNNKKYYSAYSKTKRIKIK